MEPYNRPSANTSGAAAARQTEPPSPAPETQQKSHDERETRVAELRERYQSGKYQIEAAELSSKIVDEHLKR